jgi:hypothetical protein
MNKIINKIKSIIKVIILTVLAKGGAPAGQSCPSNTIKLRKKSAIKSGLVNFFILH